MRRFVVLWSVLLSLSSEAALLHEGLSDNFWKQYTWYIYPSISIMRYRWGTQDQPSPFYAYREQHSVGFMVNYWRGEVIGWYGSQMEKFQGTLDQYHVSKSGQLGQARLQILPNGEFFMWGQYDSQILSSDHKPVEEKYFKGRERLNWSMSVFPNATWVFERQHGLQAWGLQKTLQDQRELQGSEQLSLHWYFPVFTPPHWTEEYSIQFQGHITPP